MKQALKVARCKTIIEDHVVSGDGGNRTTSAVARSWPIPQMVRNAARSELAVEKSSISEFV